MNAPLVQEVLAERYVIEDDWQADRAARKAMAIQAECDRLVEHHRRQIEAAKKACTEEKSFYEIPLHAYVLSCPGRRETKTQIKYTLPSGELVLTKAKADYDHEDEQGLIDWMKANGYGEYVKTLEKPMWGEFKKRLVIQGGLPVVKDTGEVVGGLCVMEKPEKFDIREAPRHVEA